MFPKYYYHEDYEEEEAAPYPYMSSPAGAL